MMMRSTPAKNAGTTPDKSTNPSQQPAPPLQTTAHLLDQMTGDAGRQATGVGPAEARVRPVEDDRAQHSSSQTVMHLLRRGNDSSSHSSDEEPYKITDRLKFPSTARSQDDTGWTSDSDDADWDELVTTPPEQAIAVCAENYQRNLRLATEAAAKRKLTAAKDRAEAEAMMHEMSSDTDKDCYNRNPNASSLTIRADRAGYDYSSSSSSDLDDDEDSTNAAKASAAAPPIQASDPAQASAAPPAEETKSPTLRL